MASKEWRALPAALILAATTALADPPALLRAPDPVQLDLLGSAVAATPDLIFTSYPSRAPALKGKLFTFVHGGSGWSQESTFNTDWYGDGLGLAVAVQGDLLVIGAPMRRNAPNDAIAMRGRVHFLRRSAQGSLNEIGWYSGALAAEQIGFSVALDGGTAIIGAPGGGSSTNRVGSVRFFNDAGTTVSLAVTIVAPATPKVRNFGQGVAIAGDWAAASANLYRGDTPLAGVVHLMHRDGNGTWSIAETLQSPISETGDRFGLSLAMRGDLLLVGAPAPGTGGELARGAAYLYRRINDTWTLESVFMAPGDEFCEGFGRAVAIGQGIVAINAVSAQTEASGSSAVFLYRPGPVAGEDPWMSAGVRIGQSGTDFGAALAFAGGRLVIGEPGATVDGIEAAGAVHVIDLAFADLNNDGIVNGADLAMLLGAWGPALPGNPADLNLDGVVNGNDLALLLGNWS